MSYADDENSVEAAQPCDLFTVVTPLTTYRLNDYGLPITFGGQTYAPATITRSNTPTNAIDGQSSAARQVTVEVSLNHALAQELLVGGIPWAQDVTVQIATYMQRSGAAQNWFFGTIASIDSDGNTCKLLLSGKIDQKLSIQLPVLTSQRLCPHGLYDAGCTLSASSFQVSGTVTSVSGTTIGISTIGGNPDHWAQYGKIVRSLDGEPRSITEQIGTTITVNVPFRTLHVGDAIVLNAGCDHAVTTCRDKFSNVINYGGHPQLPTINVQIPTGLGVVLKQGS